MKKRTLLLSGIILTFLIFVAFGSLLSSAGGATPIGSAEELLTLMNTPSMWGGDYLLTEDIDLAAYAGQLAQAPIGNSSSSAFTGSFDGAGHIVRGLDFSGYTARTARVGLFGAVKDAVISDLTVSGSVTAGGQDVGGLVGIAYGHTQILNCTNDCTVSGNANVGGIAGRAHGADAGVLIRGCKNCGAVTSATKNAGGILGGANNTDGPLTVEKCINTGAVTGATGVGGIAGLFNATPSSGSTSRTFILSECVNGGAVTTTAKAGVLAYAGGVVGAYMRSDIRDCQNLGTVVSQNGATAVGGVLGGNEKTGGAVARCLDRGCVVSGGAADRYIGQVVGYPSVKPTDLCYYTEVTAGAGGGAGWKNVKVYLDKDFSALNAGGKWSKTANGPVLTFARGVVAETMPKTLFGDLNGDGRITLLDVLRVMRFIAVGETDRVVDLDRNGRITLADGLEYLKIAVNGGLTENYFAGDFVILVAGNFAGDDFAACETETASVNKALYDRNKYMLDTYGVRILTKDVVASNSSTGSGVGYDALYEEYLAGTSTYDAAMIAAQDAISAGYKGYLHDLADISTLDLSSDLWDANILSDLSTYGRNYYATGDISYVDDASASVIYFSGATLDALGLTSPYTLVENGEWTFETYYQMIRAAGADLDGDGAYSAQTDRFGLLSDSANSLSMLTAAGEKIAGFVDGELTLTLKNDKTVALYDAYQTLVRTPGYALTWERDATYNSGDITAMMNEGRALFWSRTLLNYRTLKNGGVAFGLVPFPKYDAAQSGYKTRIDAYASQYVCVPETVKNLERSGRILTLLAERGALVEAAYRTDVATDKTAGSIRRSSRCSNL